MKKGFKAMALATAAVMAVSAAGCNLVKVDQEKDLAQSVATVNGVEINKKTFQDLVTQYSSMYEQYGQPTDGLPDQILESLIQQELLIQKAKEEGLYDFNEEQQKKYDEFYEENMSYYASQFAATAQEELGEDASQEEIDKRARELFEEDIQANESYSKEEMEQELKDQFAVGLLQEKIGDTVKTTDEDVKKWYDEELEKQKTEIKENPSAFESKNPALYVPEGYRRVKHILITFDDDVSTKVNELKTKQSEIATEIGALMTEDEKANAARLTELRNENAELKKELETVQNETKAKAQEVLEKANAAGAKFEDLMVEYSADTAGQDKADPETTFLVGPNTTNLVEPFVKAASALKEGEISDIVESDYGYHIIKDVEDLKEGDVPLADVKDEAKEVVDAAKKLEAWNGKVEEWTEDAVIVKNEAAMEDNTDKYEEGEQGEADSSAETADAE